ncbi:hypothetical protein H4R27_006601 [Coemansia aciculifera]|nr:hypothetical protein H4R27_006601 [Coemansia aciculifera]
MQSTHRELDTRMAQHGTYRVPSCMNTELYKHMELCRNMARYKHRALNMDSVAPCMDLVALCMDSVELYKDIVEPYRDLVEPYTDSAVPYKDLVG